MTDQWNRTALERHKRNFIETRLRFRTISLHAALIFGITWAAGWAASAVLLHAGLTNMPLRYAISFALSYPVFFLCVRVWADFMRRERAGTWDLGPSIDLPLGGEGCLILLVALMLGFGLATLFAWIGGPTLLLEVAFEVVFSGTLVQRLGRTEMVGNWARALWLKTLPHALSVLIVLTGIAYWLQTKAPNATTFTQAVKVVFQ
jgi:hypothetical protein